MSEAKELKTLNTLYGVLIALTVISFVPNLTLAMIALVGFIIYLAVLYSVKGKAEEHGLLENHCQFLIKTIWITSLFSVFSLAAAAIYFLPQYSPDSMNQCMDDVMNSLMRNPNMDMDALQTMIQPCVDTFMSENSVPLLNAGIIAFAPIVIYFIYRLYKGGSRALKGYRIANPKAWF